MTEGSTPPRHVWELMDASRDVLWMFNHDWGELIFVNSAYEDIWGRSVATLEENPRDFLDGIHPEDRDRVTAAMETLSNGDPVEIEYRVNADEEYGRWVWVQGEPIRDSDGDVVRIAGFARDVTARKERERELDLERDRFQALFENLGEPVVEVRFDGGDPIVTKVNDAFTDAFDVGNDARGENLDDLIVPDREAETAVSINALASSGESVESQVRRGTDDPQPYLFRSAPFEAPNGEQRGHGIYIDIAERVEQQRALERQNERLDDLMGVVSHDLRNLLNLAQGQLRFAREECESGHLDTVTKAHDRMATLVEDLLVLARSGDRVRDPEPVELADLVTGCVETVATAGATVATDLDGRIRADPSRLQQLFENLIRNAVEHGGDDVTVRIGELDDETGIYVEDDGSGIPEEDRERVFESGYSTVEGGTGLGLKIVREVVRAHGWEIGVTESEAGGARFEITGVEFIC